MTPEERARVLAAMDRASYGFVAGGAMNLHEAMLTAAYPLIREAVLREGWEPIETAPKDGTKFLALENFKRDGDDGRIYPEDAAVVRWATSRHDGYGAWSGYGLFLESFEPTHWRPLPAPPAGGRDGK